MSAGALEQLALCERGRAGAFFEQAAARLAGTTPIDAPPAKEPR